MVKELGTESIHIIMYVFYAFIFAILIAAALLSYFEIWIFKPYKRGYAPPGISTGANKSPYTPT